MADKQHHYQVKIRWSRNCGNIANSLNFPVNCEPVFN